VIVSNQAFCDTGISHLSVLFSFFHFFKFKEMSSVGMESHNWQGYTLIMPSVCYCHIGQIAVDMLINSLKMKSAMILDWQCVEPIVAFNPYLTNQEEELAFGCQVYEASNLKLLVIQQRGSIVSGKRQEFVNELLSFFKKYKLQEIIVLTAFNAVERTDVQLAGSDQFRYLSTKNEPILNWTQLEERIDKHHHKSVRERDQYYIASGGISNRLYFAAKQEKIPLTLLLMFTDVGKEMIHSHELLTRLNKWKKLNKTDKWEMPVSQKAWFETITTPPIY